jgi:hypothetical protein
MLLARCFRGGRLAILLVLPLILYALPVDYFDDKPPICLSRVLLDVECLACGMTRAVMRAMRLRIASAMSYNTLVIVVFPLLCYLWARYVWADVRYFHK